MAKKFKLLDIWVAKNPDKRIEWNVQCSCCGEFHCKRYKDPNKNWVASFKKPGKDNFGLIHMMEDPICSNYCPEEQKAIFKNILKKVKPGENKKFRIHFEEIK